MSILHHIKNVFLHLFQILMTKVNMLLPYYVKLILEFLKNNDKEASYPVNSHTTIMIFIIFSGITLNFREINSTFQLLNCQKNKLQ